MIAFELSKDFSHEDTYDPSPKATNEARTKKFLTKDLTLVING